MEQNRRQVLKSGAAATLIAGVSVILYAQNTPNQIKVELDGYGSRGSGAIT